jgi:hypothetical protein
MDCIENEKIKGGYRYTQQGDIMTLLTSIRRDTDIHSKEI